MPTPNAVAMPRVGDFFRRAQADSRKGAEQGKQLMLSRLRATG
ncbi:hypothetical protein C8K38_10845 [Rhodococcus sp. OK611]|nr:hypothetical protein C8K38_10845 [Rhodococcus sp. OK611]SNX91038.1 hypothetical protein SAMN05447004_10844 [Rhodococcus sp. OK270]